MYFPSEKLQNKCDVLTLIFAMNVTFIILHHKICYYYYNV